MADEQVEFICDVLKDAVVVILDPTSSPQQRSEAQQFCDDVKEKSDVCAPCGLKLAEKTASTPVRYYGLQLVEHHVRHRWYTLSLDKRKSLKVSVMGLVASGTKPILEEENCIKEALVRILVDIIKNNWTTRWAELLAEMRDACSQGATQAELVMLSLLLLADDAMLWHTNLQRPLGYEEEVELKNKRHVVLAIVRSVLKDYINNYKVHKRSAEALEHECRRLIISALNTLAAYVRSVPLEYITENKCQLLTSLWCLQSESDLQLEAAEVLILAVKRISKIPANKRMIVELADEFAPIVFPFPMTSAEDALTERGYSFLKSRCQLLCLFGEQFFPSASTPANAKIPSTFAKYLNSLLSFTTHCSQFLISLTQKTWRVLFSHEALRTNSDLLAVLPKYLRAASINLMMVGFPSKNNSRKCDFSRLDFATDQAFSKFLRAFRGKQRKVIDAACNLYPEQCLETAISCLKRQLTSSFDCPLENVRIPGDVNSDSSRSYLKWEALTYFIEIIVGNTIQSLQLSSSLCRRASELLQTVLTFKTEDPNILAFVPKLLDVFQPFLNFKHGCVSSVLTKLLEVIQQIRSPDGRLLKMARRDACILINKLCKERAQDVLLDFNMFFNQVKQLLCNELLQLTQMEKNALVEAMVVLINHLMDYKQQKAFLESLLAPVSSLWLSEEMGRVLAEPEAFLSYVGADLKITNTPVESPMDLNRSGILHCLATILEVLRWSCCPADLNKAVAGGFVIGFMDDGEPILLNPCTEHVLKLLDHVFVLIRTQHKLFVPTVLSKMKKRFARALDFLEVKTACSLDLQPLMAIYDPPEYKTALERLQYFFSTMYASCFCILGYAASSLKQGFYTIPNLCNKLLYFALENLEKVPDYRQLVMFRSFLKPLVHSSPPEYYETLVPRIMGAFLLPLHTRLSHELNIVDQCCKSNPDETAVGSTGCVKFLPKQLKRLIKEVIELIIECCVSHEEQDIIANTDKSNTANVQDKLEKVRDSCSQAADKLLGVVKSSPICLHSNEVDATTVCVPESDDYMCTDEDSACAMAATVKSDNEQAESSSESDDGEEAAEAAEEPQSTPLVPPENTQLTTLGICLMEHEDVRSALLAIAYSSLLWEDLTCYESASSLCWPLLEHVLLAPLHADTVTYFMTMVLKGLQVHKHDKFSNCAFDQLAFQIYMCLRPRYIELNKVIIKILNVNLCYLEKFDKCVLDQPIQKSDDELLCYFKCLLYGRIEGPFFDQHFINPLQIKKKSRKRPPYYMRSNKLLKPVYNPMNRPLPYQKKGQL